MPIWVCPTCGANFPPGPEPPAGCPLCEDERQWVPPTGQVGLVRWTVLVTQLFPESVPPFGHTGAFRQVVPAREPPLGQE